MRFALVTGGFAILFEYRRSCVPGRLRIRCRDRIAAPVATPLS